jgi:Flp pilus assembly protein TadB
MSRQGSEGAISNSDEQGEMSREAYTALLRNARRVDIAFYTAIAWGPGLILLVLVVLLFMKPSHVTVDPVMSVVIGLCVVAVLPLYRLRKRLRGRVLESRQMLESASSARNERGQ